MLYDDVLARTLGDVPDTDRRDSERRLCPADLLVVWHDDPATTHRYRIVNVSAGGFMLRSTLPLIEGSTGVARRMLPGDDLDETITVQWVSPAGPFRGYDIGVRVVEAERGR